MHARRAYHRIDIDPEQETFSIRSARKAYLIGVSVLLAAGALAMLLAYEGGYRHRVATWGWILAGIWWMVGLIVGGVTLWPRRELVVDLRRGTVEIDGAPYPLSQTSFTYELEQRYAGRRTMTVCVLYASVPGRGTVKLLELHEREASFVHNLVAGLQQAQAEPKPGIETLHDALLAAGSEDAREITMLIAVLLLVPVLVWMKGGFR